MAWYQEAWGKGGGTSAILERFYNKLSKLINSEFDLVLKEASVVDNKKMLQNVYQWALRFPGHGFSDLFSEDELKTLLEAKQKKGSVL